MPTTKTLQSKTLVKSLSHEIVADESAPEVLPRSSSSSLTDLYSSQEFSLGWDNDVKHHIARNLLHLRRYRGDSQTVVAKTMGTSQPAIARIEAGEENFKANTLERLIYALRGRFVVSIVPEEFEFHRLMPWWEPAVNQVNDWMLEFVARQQTEDGELALVGMSRNTPDPVIVSSATT